MNISQSLCLYSLAFKAEEWLVRSRKDAGTDSSHSPSQPAHSSTGQRKLASHSSWGRKPVSFPYCCSKWQFPLLFCLPFCSPSSMFQPMYAAHIKGNESHVLGNYPFCPLAVFYYLVLCGSVTIVVILLRKISQQKLLEQSFTKKQTWKVKRHWILSQWLSHTNNGWERTATHILTNQTSF